MNIKAIIASLVLGSSSVAMAAPSVTVTATVQGSYGTTIVRDHRDHDDDNRYILTSTPPAIQPTYQDEGWNRGGFNGRKLPPVYRPVTLASGLSFAGDGRKFITVGAQAGRFETLQISAAGGRTFLQEVYVQFDNGQEQVIRNLDRTLTGNESVTLDLDGGRRGIRRIVVYGNGNAVGHRWSAGAFTVTAS
jgi:hypothetical protein